MSGDAKASVLTWLGVEVRVRVGVRAGVRVGVGVRVRVRVKASPLSVAMIPLKKTPTAPTGATMAVGAQPVAHRK